MMDIPLGSNRIDIPPGERAYRATDHFTVPVDVDVLAINPHAHYVCREMYGYAVLPDGTRRTLIRIPRVEFRLAAALYLCRSRSGCRPVPASKWSSLTIIPRRTREIHTIPRGESCGDPASTDEMAGLHIEVSPVDSEDAEELSQALWGKMMRQLGENPRSASVNS